MTGARALGVSTGAAGWLSGRLGVGRGKARAVTQDRRAHEGARAGGGGGAARYDLECSRLMLVLRVAGGVGTVAGKGRAGRRA